MPIELPPLPYEYTALEPHIGEQTLRIHHDKHHARYVTVANELMVGTEYADMDLITLVRAVHNKNQGLFNNAAQVYNHNFYWDSMKPNGGGKPTGKIAELIERDFGSYEKFRAEMTQAAVTCFGSGWAWLVHTPEGLKVTKTSNAENPLTVAGQTPILTIDVWEHAYYLNFQNLRPTYVDTFFDNLVNWDFANTQLPSTA